MNVKTPKSNHHKNEINQSLNINEFFGKSADIALDEKKKISKQMKIPANNFDLNKNKKAQNNFYYAEDESQETSQVKQNLPQVNNNMSHNQQNISINLSNSSPLKGLIRK